MNPKEKKCILFLICILGLATMAMIAFGLHRAMDVHRANIEYPVVGDMVVMKQYRGQDYYICKKPMEGEYDLQCLHQIPNRENLSEIETCSVLDYTAYCTFCEHWKMTQQYTDPNLSYLVFSDWVEGSPGEKPMLAGVEFVGEIAKLYLWEPYFLGTADETAFVCIVPTDHPVKDIQPVFCFTEEQYSNILRSGKLYDTKSLPVPA